MKMNKMFGNIEFGSVKYNLSHLGIAVENAAGEMVSYDKANNEIVNVDLIDFDAKGMIYAMPCAIKDIQVGDVIKHTNGNAVFVTSTEGSIHVVVYANDTLRSIFSAALGDLYEKYKSICNQDATDSIIAPLVEKYGDKSNGGMVTYRKVYKKMGEMSPINWHNLEVRYINKHGKAGARRKKIISSNPEMLRKFKNAVDVMMVG